MPHPVRDWLEEGGMIDAVSRPIQSIERAAQALRLLSARTRRMSLMELAGEMGLPKGTAFGILRTLQQVGFVEKDAESGKYQLGPALLHLGSTYLDGNELRARALKWADSLAARSGEEVRIGTLHDSRVLVVHHVFRPDDSYQVLQVGALLPLHATAMGKALLAANTYLLAQLGEQELTRFTASTITDSATLARDLETVRERGWAADFEELVEGEVSLAVPVMDRRDQTVGAIAISGPAARLCESGGAKTRADHLRPGLGQIDLPRSGSDPVVTGPRAADPTLHPAPTGREEMVRLMRRCSGLAVTARRGARPQPHDVWGGERE